MNPEPANLKKLSRLQKISLRLRTARPAMAFKRVVRGFRGPSEYELENYCGLLATKAKIEIVEEMGEATKKMEKEHDGKTDLGQEMSRLEAESAKQLKEKMTMSAARIATKYALDSVNAMGTKKREEIHKTISKMLTSNKPVTSTDAIRNLVESQQRQINSSLGKAKGLVFAKIFNRIFTKILDEIEFAHLMQTIARRKYGGGN